MTVWCPFCHVGREKMVVCKHHLHGLCKKGAGCGFLHRHDVANVPKGYFCTKFGS